MKKLELTLVVGVVAIAGYFIYKAISQPTDVTSSSCAGDWTDYINPACWVGGVFSTVSNEVNTATNEINIILIVVGLVVVAVVGLLAFGPGTKHLVGLAAL